MTREEWVATVRELLALAEHVHAMLPYVMADHPDLGEDLASIAMERGVWSGEDRLYHAILAYLLREAGWTTGVG